jgi:protein-S-isoprenylcysteine O-methyltransferase Ste14
MFAHAMEMPVKDLPASILSCTIWAYWSGVVLMSLVSRWRYRNAAGLLPRKTSEQIVWPLWVLVVAGWNVGPWLAMRSHHLLLALPDWIHSTAALTGIRLTAACLGVAALLLTVRCWIAMGRSWSMAVVPGKKTELVTSGLYAYVRHPIYFLSICLMLTSLFVIPTPLMLGLAVVHIGLLTMKARCEEQFLLALHGAGYADYCRRTGRFCPRLQVRGAT